MELNTLEKKLTESFPNATIELTGDGRHFSVTIVDNAFDGLTLIQRERKVLSSLGAEIASGELHALSVRAVTPSEQ